MRRKRTSASPNFTLIQGGGGEEESGSALNPYGPVRAGLTTSPQTNKVQALSVLLNDLEKKTDDLEFRYLRALDIFLSATELLVKQKRFGIDTDITKE
jgi:hypothetical protein